MAIVLKRPHLVHTAKALKKQKLDVIHKQGVVTLNRRSRHMWMSLEDSALIAGYPQIIVNNLFTTMYIDRFDNIADSVLSE